MFLKSLLKWTPAGRAHGGTYDVLVRQTHRLCRGVYRHYCWPAQLSARHLLLPLPPLLRWTSGYGEQQQAPRLGAHTPSTQRPDVGAAGPADSPLSRPAGVPTAGSLGDVVMDSMSSCCPRVLILFTLAQTCCKVS